LLTMALHRACCSGRATTSGSQQADHCDPGFACFR
jgi:hypothetical protein